jgi:hypothetical protein
LSLSNFNQPEESLLRAGCGHFEGERQSAFHGVIKFKKGKHSSAAGEDSLTHRSAQLSIGVEKFYFFCQ